VDHVRVTAEGSRNHALNKAGVLPRAASVHFGAGDPPFTPGDARATISSAIAAGKRKPRPLATRRAAA